ncbi:MAG: phosphate/phosphite/phosphonate ABC transporter substrate-binding protein [Nitrosopumilus sp.]|nr:phosphate/phosphite/phosphonate ABC transporter substrate-binding protein [Nitrosopumilus sp.]MDH3824453.1 phosphate/phosphite/phosphonate ABC transporter substrate-binding protein [Nitrosopumilus sp.]
MKQNTTLLLITAISVIGITSILFAQNAEAQSLVPEWIKNNAAWWAEGSVDDQTFLNGIEFLIENGVINVSSANSSVDVEKLTIGFIPIEKADELTSKAQSLEEFLENELGVDVEIVVPTDYETIIEGMRFGHIDAAFMDTGPAWIAHQRSGSEAVLAELVEGKVNYQATVWTRSDDTSIQTIEDVVGKKVAFTSITGSSGFVRPMGTLVTGGHIQVEGDDIVALEMALSENFESYTFAGGYKAALQLLINENVDVAFGSDIAAQKYLELDDQAKIRPVTTIGPVPSHVFMVNADMSESTKNALVGALVKLNYDENNEILQNLYGAEALVPTTTSMHIGEFGTFIDALTGLDQKILDKYNKSK